MESESTFSCKVIFKSIIGLDNTWQGIFKHKQVRNVATTSLSSILLGLGTRFPSVMNRDRVTSALYNIKYRYRMGKSI